MTLRLSFNSGNVISEVQILIVISALYQKEQIIYSPIFEVWTPIKF